MLHPLFSSLLACSSDLQSVASTAPGPTLDAASCEGADQAVAGLVSSADALAAEAGVTVAAGENYAAMRALALRAASPATTREERSADVSEVSQRVDLAVRIAADYPDLLPEALGLADLRLGDTVAADGAVRALNVAIDELSALLADLTADHNATVAEITAVLVQFPDCSGPGVAPLEPVLDAGGPAIDAALDNVADAAALAQASADTDRTAGDTIHQIRALAVSAASETISDGDRSVLQQTFCALSAEVDRIAATASFNGYPYADGFMPRFSIPVGYEHLDVERVSVATIDLRASALGIDTASLDLSNAAGAASAIDSIDNARSNLSVHEGAMGAVLAVLEEENARLESE